MEAITVFLAAVIVVVLVRIPRVLAPRHYFELHEIIHGMNNTITWQAIALRFFIPFAVALAATLALGRNSELVGLGIGFLGALLLVWPALLDSRLRPWPAMTRPTELYLLYAMFVASFALLGLGAGFFATFLRDPMEEAFAGSGGRATLDAATARLGDVAVGLVVIGIASALAWTWKKLEKWVQRRPDVN